MQLSEIQLTVIRGKTGGLLDSDGNALYQDPFTNDMFLSNSHLTSLESCPTEVRAFFNVSHNKSSTLKYGPKKVLGRYQ